MTQEDCSLVVLTYNIHSCVGSDGIYSVDRIAHFLTQINADVVCLQEVEVNTVQQTTRIWSVAHQDDQPGLIAEKAGYPHVIFARAICSKANIDMRSESFTDDGDGQFGIAILSKWPIQEHQILQFSPYSTKTPRNALGCSILMPSEGNIWVVCTHLGCHFLGGEQLQQAQELIDFVEKLQSTGLPVVLAGDLNCPYWFAAVKEIKTVLTDASSGGKGTFPSTGLFQGSMKLDYILYTSSGITSTGATVHTDGAIASDHRPLSSCLRIQRKVDGADRLLQKG